MTAYPIKAQELISRLSPRLGADIRNEVGLALGIAGTVRENVAKITADKRYSPEGHRDQIKQMLGKGPFGHLDQIRSKLTKPLESCFKRTAKFTIKGGQDRPVRENAAPGGPYMAPIVFPTSNAFAPCWNWMTPLSARPWPLQRRNAAASTRRSNRRFLTGCWPNVLVMP